MLRMIKVMVLEVPFGLPREDGEVITAKALEEDFPNATRVEIPKWNLRGDGSCCGYVLHHFASGKGMLITLNYALRPADDDLNKISPRYEEIPGIILKGRQHIFIPVDGKMTWGDLRGILQKLQTIIYHRIIHSGG